MISLLRLVRLVSFMTLVKYNGCKTWQNVRFTSQIFLFPGMRLHSKGKVIVSNHFMGIR